MMGSVSKLPRRLQLSRPHQMYGLLILFCVLTLTFYFMSDSQDDFQYLISSSYNFSEEIPDKYLVWNSKCHMLSMDPYDPSMKPFVKKEKFEACSTRLPLSNIARKPDGSVYLVINQDAAKNYENLICYWAVITRPKISNTIYFDFDSKIRVGPCEQVQNQVLLKADVDVVLVTCYDGDTEEVYKNAHAVFNPKRVRHRNSNSNQKSKVTDGSTSEKKNKTLSVLILGLDSVSRLNFYRTMPITRNFFNKRGWMELRAYNKMGDNTLPNLMAILSGQNETMSTNTICDKRRPYWFDNCSMIWNNYRNSGYVTAYAEDTTNINTFNNIRAGFVEPPTDFYLRPYVLATEKLLEKRKRFGWIYCSGPELSADRIYDAAIDFATTFKDQPYFGFFWTNSLTHEFLNVPSMYDTRFLSKLQIMENNGVMNDSILIVLSDHGMRFDDSRDTFIGWYEERLPFVYIWLPQWFREQNPHIRDALTVNQDRLTSPYDLYETLRDILQRSGGQAVPSSGCPMCSSLFKPVPFERGCRDAGISLHWCTCAGFEPYDITDPIVLHGAEKFVEYVNNITKNYTNPLGMRLCSVLKLKRIYRVRKLLDFDDKKLDRKILKLFYSLELTPGGGKFETTITYHRDLVRYTIREEDVSRINRYGPDATCLEKGYKKYCQCRWIIITYSRIKGLVFDHLSRWGLSSRPLQLYIRSNKTKKKTNIKICTMCTAAQFKNGCMVT